MVPTGAVLIIMLVGLAIYMYRTCSHRPRPYAQPPDQNIDTNPLMGSNPASFRELYDWSQSGSGSGTGKKIF